MKHLLLLSFLVLSFGSVMAEENEGRDCKAISQTKEVKSSEPTEVKKPAVKGSSSTGI